MPAFLAVVATIRWTVRRSRGLCSSAMRRCLVPDVDAVACRPLLQQRDELGVERDHAVVAQLADGDAQPVDPSRTETASAASSQSSVARMPVRDSISTTRR